MDRSLTKYTQHLGKKIIKNLGLSFEAISSNSTKAAAVLHSGKHWLMMLYINSNLYFG